MRDAWFYLKPWDMYNYSLISGYFTYYPLKCSFDGSNWWFIGLIEHFVILNWPQVTEKQNERFFNLLWMLCSSLMNFLGLWLSDRFPSEAVVSFSRYTGVVGVPGTDGAARRSPAIILREQMYNLNWERNKGSNLYHLWNIILEQRDTSKKKCS